MNINLQILDDRIGRDWPPARYGYGRECWDLLCRTEGSMNDQEFKAEWYRDESERKQRRLERLGELIGTLYSERGEDKRTAELCGQAKDELEKEGV